MELHEFAHQVLFAETLAQKLAAPREEITDLSPGPPLSRIDQPGRPANLRFRREPAPPLPTEHALQSEEQRAVLLHFFANHELLATELMALALLRFPGAPREFRSGLYETLREEQRHTLCYLRRLEECGTSFGDLPVNDFFWKAVSTMDTPLDYVTRLSLTFEQANLDYSLHYAAILDASGDLKSARILRSIYRDEIGHVQYGLHWFRQWKPAHLSDWEAFERLLPFPLSPSRAKGNGRSPFNAEGRRLAGLPGDFIRELRHFERSKGRTPSVHFFCPAAETEMAGGLSLPSQRLPQNVRDLALDLEILSAFLCSRDDVLLVRRLPSLAHREKLRAAGFHLPEFELLAPGETLAPGSLTRQRKLERLSPWAWGPHSAILFEPLRTNLAPAARAATPVWGDPLRLLFSKTHDLSLARRLLETAPTPAAGKEVLGRAVSSEEELLRAVAAFRDLGFAEVLVKAPFGASGQANHRWREGHVLPWCRRTLSRQGCLVVEPWLDRVFDFSAHYDHTPSGLRFLGLVRLSTDSRGQFRAVQAGPRFTHGLHPDLARFLAVSVLPYFRDSVPPILEEVLRSASYTGPVGVDSFVYRDQTGDRRFKPIVELNPRFTMGRVLLEIQRRAVPSLVARLELHRHPPPEDPIPHLAPGPDPAGQTSLLLNEPCSPSPLFARLRTARSHTALWEEPGAKG